MISAGYGCGPRSAAQYEAGRAAGKACLEGEPQQAIMI